MPNYFEQLIRCPDGEAKTIAFIYHARLLRIGLLLDSEDLSDLECLMRITAIVEEDEEDE